VATARGHFSRIFLAARRLLFCRRMSPEPFLAEVLPHRESLRRAARRLRPRDADDLVQETYLRALLARERYRSGSNAGAWLHRILVNAALSEHRKSGRERRLHARIAFEPRTEEAAETTATSPRLDSLQAALATLPSHERRVVELTELRGLRYRDAARELGCPIGTVMSRLHRARAHLRERMQLLPER
jgi:RNA polymerase sigma-70 factor (ECF subfamily)